MFGGIFLISLLLIAGIFSSSGALVGQPQRTLGRSQRVPLRKNEIEPKDLELPRNLIAFVAANCNQLEPEYYTAKVKPYRDNSWVAVLVS